MSAVLDKVSVQSGCIDINRGVWSMLMMDCLFLPSWLTTMQAHIMKFAASDFKIETSLLVLRDTAWM